VPPDVKTTVSEDVRANPTTDWLISDEMSDLLRSFDWSDPIAALNTWFQSLRTALSICLASQFPMFVYWGLKRIQFYSNRSGGSRSAIALTAYAGEIDQEQAILAGFQRHVPKPVEPEVLVRVIADLIQQIGGQAKR